MNEVCFKLAYQVKSYLDNSYLWIVPHKSSILFHHEGVATKHWGLILSRIGDLWEVITV